jgi:hypothetical protein
MVFAAQIVAIVCSGLFSGAALYISFVEHPARIEAGGPVALAEFGPSYRRATVMQAGLAVCGTAASVVAWLGGSNPLSLVAGVVLFAVVPFTLVVIFPTNKGLLDAGLDPSSVAAKVLLVRWGNLHAVRSVLGLVAFVLSVLSFRF